MFTARSLLPFIGVLLSVALAAPAQAQAVKRSPQTVVATQAASSKVIDGITYYYDAHGDPLYYDDPVHYNPPKRFDWRNGGWVMSTRGGGHHYGSRGVLRSRAIRPLPMPTDAAGHPKTNPPHTDTPAAAKPAPTAPRATDRTKHAAPAAVPKTAAPSRQAAPPARVATPHPSEKAPSAAPKHTAAPKSKPANTARPARGDHRGK